MPCFKIISHYDISNYISYNHISSAHHAYIAAITTTSDPVTFKEATSHPNWIQAMDNELKALTLNKTWILATLPQGNNLHIINQTKHLLHQHFKLKDLGSLKYFLGLKIARNSKGININQRKYTLDLLSTIGLLACKPSKTPMARDTRLAADKGTPMTEVTKFRKLIGQLIYLFSTRPDIAYVVQQLSQHIESPTNIHYEAALRVLRYLKVAPAQGLFFPNNHPLQIKAFSDSDWATCPDTRRSITGYCIFQWIHNLLKDINIPFHTPATLYCDNASARHIATNSSFHERTKHIDLDWHLVREKLQQRLFLLLPVTSNQQLADVFTKLLDTTPFMDNVTKLGLHSIYS
ncbi:uncharacterized mitochondrial protein AtMg00810-like [Vicia villosa]|uniref:uncharacterized mitochondrial protein AtMg00810-like n=1 Tax=Vicia villosa TaxID=3911 RepID=UPI00273BB353|nr:uncharacterized mitochondrial protein AtMg00810-like [Vicia villosa]